MSQKSKKSIGDVVVTSKLVFPVAEFRTKWERLWPKDEMGTTVTNQESFVKSRVQRYSVDDSKQISKQVGYMNTVNTARVYSDGDKTWCWVVHSKLGPHAKTSTGKVYTSMCFIQPSANE
ncbi:SpermaTHecal expression [Caenorhabditis elegans]|uniref:Novel protein n=1 Tax=Caenorhabditis elegans TaxID=6239 RepID=G5ECQ4_CAEEL|nr:SpermaTHecal expression [Caenorhabditis elegans]BAB69890.1 novel protein [Caenorhabditis elegans]CCD64074.1 SpermaTHecal expression [Caenorhabditis elegans]|eukprot:NP_741574.1 SpermaTHecal expression [Caenorhabditis elegans]